MMTQLLSFWLISLFCSSSIYSKGKTFDAFKADEPSKETIVSQKHRTVETDSDEMGIRSSYEGNYFLFDDNGNPLYAPTYGNDKLLQWVRPGDILYDTVGLNYGTGTTGHIGIVEAIVGTGSNRYIRTIEAVPNFGVARAVLDSTRFASNKIILRVGSATQTQKNNAIGFCINQIGKPYFIHPVYHSSGSSESWYCSELVWAAYINQGVSVASLTDPLYVMPTHISSASNCHPILDCYAPTTVTQGDAQHTYHCNGSHYSENHLLDIQVASNIFVCSICNKMIFPGG